ncbi:hypothetical protein FOG51_00028 [Hanseniaspora uvarum]|uniref:Mitochondrial import inner membrane translocase subunit TIM50 n=1 Tax=Hanseniaspora uvarum TaxID=29833 RepID=A0A1E5RJL0_HANUV|nr:hypothetical protein FOG48_01695 [Hanseniaspora uvarum]KKA01295.1 Mitochondrial import inner membrane translocase subunit HuTIM50 [Hanseniaspora uvarum DSM 2768]KAF0274850.1 hypothetical protein FOG51_00028 [Hanseniaspora uvarum]KAF0277783.1 hypothetical protein FOG50_01361 [Hanseniaspora uvarum]OEJ87076.1 Mitochondrial import inner membrane translocase subunit TIM50 [Hanseniaspora uvarum]
MFSIIGKNIIRNNNLTFKLGNTTKVALISNKSQFHNFNALLNEKKPKKPESLISDDILARAGFELNEQGKPITEQQETEQKQKAREQEEKDNEPLNELEESIKKRKEKRKRQTQTDKQIEKATSYFYVGLLGAVTGLTLYLGRDFNSEELQGVYGKEYKDVGNGFNPPTLVFKRIIARFNALKDSFNNPPFETLLPPPPPAPYQRPLTLVLGLEDLLIHSEYDYKNGWQTKKRPGVDFFLGYLSQYYEIVIYSREASFTMEPVILKLDPIQAFIAYNLFKEHCSYKNGEYVKDLSKLNRDIKKVVSLDLSSTLNTDEFEDNKIYINNWEGDRSNKDLLDYIPFLEYLVTQNVSDVRPIIKTFNNKTTLAQDFNKRIDVLREKFYDEQSKKSASGIMKIVGMGAPSASGVGAKFPLDFIREEGLKNYKAFKQLVEEEKEKIMWKQERMKQTFTLSQYLTGQISQEDIMKQQMAKDAELEEEYKAFKKAEQAKVEN